MTLLFTRNLHADGWWDHMPPGHRVDIVMNPWQMPSSRYQTATRPASRASIRSTTVSVSEPIVPTDQTGRTSPRRRIKRSHASAWILLAAVGATGGALAVAAMHDPQGMRQHLDATLAEVKNITGLPSTDTTITAQADATAVTPEPTSVQEPAPVAATEAIVPDPHRSSDARLMPVAPAAGQGGSDTATAPRLKHLTPPATDMTRDLAETQQVIPKPLPPAPLPAVEAPPTVEAPSTVIAPLAVQPSDEVAPPPVQAPASSPQP